MAIAAAARSHVGSPLGVFARLLRPPSAEDLPFAGPLLGDCHIAMGANEKRRRLRDCQAAATAVRHVSIATARSP
jgi:hypothetical protein